MADALSPWVAEAADLPVAFAQVREDPRIDRFVIERAGDGARVCMVASGGCTAAVVVAVPNVAAVHLVDANPAQLALARLKLRLLQTEGTAFRLALVGGGAMTASDRGERLAAELGALGLPPHALGEPTRVQTLIHSTSNSSGRASNVPASPASRSREHWRRTAGSMSGTVTSSPSTGERCSPSSQHCRGPSLRSTSSHTDPWRR